MSRKRKRGAIHSTSPTGAEEPDVLARPRKRRKISPTSRKFPSTPKGDSPEEVHPSRLRRRRKSRTRRRKKKPKKEASASRRTRVKTVNSNRSGGSGARFSAARFIRECLPTVGDEMSVSRIVRRLKRSNSLPSEKEDKLQRRILTSSARMIDILEFRKTRSAGECLYLRRLHDPCGGPLPLQEMCLRGLLLLGRPCTLNELLEVCVGVFVEEFGEPEAGVEKLKCFLRSPMYSVVNPGKGKVACSGMVRRIEGRPLKFASTELLQRKEEDILGYELSDVRKRKKRKRQPSSPSSSDSSSASGSSSGSGQSSSEDENEDEEDEEEEEEQQRSVTVLSARTPRNPLPVPIGTESAPPPPPLPPLSQTMTTTTTSTSTSSSSSSVPSSPVPGTTPMSTPATPTSVSGGGGIDYPAGVFFETQGIESVVDTYSQLLCSMCSSIAPFRSFRDPTSGKYRLFIHGATSLATRSILADRLDEVDAALENLMKSELWIRHPEVHDFILCEGDRIMILPMNLLTCGRDEVILPTGLQWMKGYVRARLRPPQPLIPLVGRLDDRPATGMGTGISLPYEIPDVTPGYLLLNFSAMLDRYLSSVVTPFVAFEMATSFTVCLNGAKVRFARDNFRGLLDVCDDLFSTVALRRLWLPNPVPEDFVISGDGQVRIQPMNLRFCQAHDPITATQLMRERFARELKL